MLEDALPNILNKALKGNGLNLEALATKAQVNFEELTHAWPNLECQHDLIKTICPILKLEASKLANFDNNYANSLPTLPVEITQIISPFGELGVNSWLIKFPSQSWLFDTGTSQSPAFHQLNASEKIDAIFLTHSDFDHIGGVNQATQPFAKLFSSFQLKTSLDLTLVAPGQKIEAFSTKIQTFSLRGHAPDGCGYYFSLNQIPICIVGDALFAGSIGGCPSPKHYRQALDDLDFLIAEIPDDTLLLPGHGPASQIKLEKSFNPFLMTA